MVVYIHITHIICVLYAGLKQAPQEFAILYTLYLSALTLVKVYTVQHGCTAVVEQNTLTTIGQRMVVLMGHYAEITTGSLSETH